MDPYFGEKDGGGDYHALCEQRRRQRREKKRRRQRKILCMSAAGTAVIILAVLVVAVRTAGSSHIPSWFRKEDTAGESGTRKDGVSLAQNKGGSGEPDQTDQPEQDPSTGQDGIDGETDQPEKDPSDGQNGNGEEAPGQDTLTDPDAAADKPEGHFVTDADTDAIRSKKVISTHAVLIDERTDTIIASRKAAKKISPASMTKVLTVLVAAEQISQADLDDKFTITLEITDYAFTNECSSVGFLDGEKVTVRDLFYGTVLPSGGDAAAGLAVYVSGSMEAFVDLMNEKLEELGIAGSAHMTNCVGLYDKNHYCTVTDMAVIMKAALQNPLCREVLSAHTYTTTPTKKHPEGITISNWFLRRIEDKDTGGEVLCAKTGFVIQSGNCAVSYGTFAGGTPCICVTAGSSSSWRCIYDHVEIYKKYARSGK